MGMARKTNTPAPHAGETGAPAIPKAGQTPGMGAPPHQAGDDEDQPVLDPKNPASKPQGTTKDQVDTMEGEGQAQQPGQDPKPNKDARGF
jgi:hypothetical protein